VTDRIDLLDEMLQEARRLISGIDIARPTRCDEEHADRPVESRLRHSS
jgi:hypothetical protein